MSSYAPPVSPCRHGSVLDSGHVTSSKRVKMLSEAAKHDTDLKIVITERLSCEAHVESHDSPEDVEASSESEEDHADRLEEAKEDSASYSSPTIHSKRKHTKKLRPVDEKDEFRQITARCKAYVHNNLTIGQNFHDREAFGNAGGHNELVASPCAGADGVYAIVVADVPYHGYNRDFGDVFHYTAPGCNKSTATQMFFGNMWTKALQESNTDQYRGANQSVSFVVREKTGHITMHDNWLLEPGSGLNIGDVWWSSSRRLV